MTSINHNQHTDSDVTTRARTHSDMLREWEDLDGDDDKSPSVDIESLKVDSWRCLPDMLRMSHSEDDEKAQDAASLLTDSGERKRSELGVRVSINVSEV